MRRKKNVEPRICNAARTFRNGPSPPQKIYHSLNDCVILNTCNIEMLQHRSGSACYDRWQTRTVGCNFSKLIPDATVLADIRTFLHKICFDGTEQKKMSV